MSARIAQIVRLTELVAAAVGQAVATAGTKRLLVAEHGQNWPLQVLQGGEEGLERGLIQLRQPPTAQRQPRG